METITAKTPWTTKASARLGRALLRSLKASIIGKEKAA